MGLVVCAVSRAHETQGSTDSFVPVRSRGIHYGKAISEYLAVNEGLAVHAGDGGEKGDE